MKILAQDDLSHRQLKHDGVASIALTMAGVVSTRLGRRRTTCVSPMPIAERHRPKVPTPTPTTQAGLALPDCVDVRFHSRLTFGDERVPGLLWLLTDIVSAEPVGVLRYFLNSDGAVIGKRVLGRSFSTVVRLSPNEEVEQAVFVASSVEGGLRAINNGLRPTWSADVAKAFPAIPGVDVTIIDPQNGTPPPDVVPSGGVP